MTFALIYQWLQNDWQWKQFGAEYTEQSNSGANLVDGCSPDLTIDYTIICAHVLTRLRVI